jgi:quinol monooxygenase YgiN
MTANKNRKSFAMRIRKFCTSWLRTLALSTVLSFATTPPTMADPPPLIYVINIDVMPPFTLEASQLLKTYRNDSLKEKGAKRVELLQRLEHGNHYAVIEEWSTQADHDAHIATNETRNFRTKIQPMLGSPFDERVHHAFD